MRGSILAVVMFLAGTAAGCLQDAGPEAQGTLSDPRPGQARPTVVALIDSGINPYHLAFAAQEGGVETFLDLVPSAKPVRLASKGSYEERVEADAAFWEGVEVGQLYAFPGTRVFGISFREDAQRPRLLDSLNHWTGTAGLVLRENPEALVVAIDVDSTICDPARALEKCPVLPQLAAALAWAADQPWIDVISMSVGIPLNPPVPSAISSDVKPFLDASRRAHESGKAIVAGAGNTVTAPLSSYYAGPPWVITVGGAQAARGGEPVESSKVVDVVANFTEYVPVMQSIDGYGWTLGTSFSTPIVSGTLAKALTQIRRSDVASEGAPDSARGPLPPGALRAALNASAQAFGPTDWKPTGRVANHTLYDLASPAAPILLSPIQQGWGFVHGGLASEIARRVLEGDLEPPPEKALTAQHQARVQALREGYWSRMG